MSTLMRYSWRAMQQRPGRSVLTTLSVVIGVGAVVAFAMITSATRNAYKEMFALVTGRSALEVVAEGNASFPEGVVDIASAVPHVRAAVPTIRRFSVLYVSQGESEESTRARLQVLGIDPERDAHIRDLTIVEGRSLGSGDEVWLDQSIARRFEVAIQQKVKLLTARGLKTFKVVGIVTARGSTTITQSGLVYLPLSRAQYLFKATGKVDAVQIVLDDDDHRERVQKAIAARLPMGTEVRLPTGHTQLMQETLVSSEQGLRLATIFSLLSASCIVFNTFLMNVSERRRQIATMRLVGATRRQIFRLLVQESFYIGVVGTVLGALAGTAFGWFLNHSIGEVTRVEMPAMELSLTPLILAALVGIGISFLGAAVPAWQAGRIAPQEGLSHGSRADTEGVPFLYVFSGLVLTLVSSGLVVASLNGWLPIEVPTYAAPFLLLGIVLLAILLIQPAARLLQVLARPVLRTEMDMAVRQVLRHRIRSSLTAGVLFIAASTGTGLAYAILDNIQNVRQWREHAFEGDYFIRAMLPDLSSGLTPDLPDGLGDDLKKVKNVRSIEAASLVEVEFRERKVTLIAREFLDSGPPPFDLITGDAKSIQAQLRNGEVVVGSVLALRFELKIGDEIQLNTLTGVKTFRICGVTNEYLAGGFSIYMDRELAIRLLGIQGVDGYVIRAVPQHIATVQSDLQKLCDRYGVLLHSFADLVAHVDTMIQGIVASLWGVIALGYFVGAFGIVNTLTMNVIEQTREFGLLRIVAMTRRQVRLTILAQALVISLVGLIPGLGSGLIVAWVLNLASMPSVGHPVAFGFHPWLLLGTGSFALSLILCAAFLPAERAARLNLMDAVRLE